MKTTGVSKGLIQQIASMAIVVSILFSNAFAVGAVRNDTINVVASTTAMAKFTTDLQQFAIAKGQPNLYHETITWGYLWLIHERMARGAKQDWEAFAATNPDLLTWEQSLLRTYYRPESLQSELARRVFVFPDHGAPSLA